MFRTDNYREIQPEQLSFKKEKIYVSGVELQAIQDHWKNSSLEEKADTIRFCRIIKMFDNSKKKLILAFGPSKTAQEIRATVTAALAAKEQVEHKIGRLPAGYMERELGLWLMELLK